MGVAAAFFVPWLARTAANKWLFPPAVTEIARTTSPDGTVDTVTEEINCGVPCSIMYKVSVVAKGAPASSSPEHEVFICEDMAKEKVSWDEPHLLEISYDEARIDMFRNVAYPLAQPGRVDSYVYLVEVRLSPTSPNFSYLPDPNKRPAPK